MANPQKGEVRFEIEGVSYTLAVSLNAMIAIGDLFQCTIGDAWKRIAANTEESPRVLRGVLWALMQRHHSDLSIEEVGDLIGLSDVEALTNALTNAAAASNPDPKDTDALGVGKKNPRKARLMESGTGEQSASARAESA